jgi:hypothetical protein
MGARSGRRDVEIPHGWKQYVGSADDQGREVVGLDPQSVAVGIERPERSGDDTDEPVGHRV